MKELRFGSLVLANSYQDLGTGLGTRHVPKYGWWELAQKHQHVTLRALATRRCIMSQDPHL